jgi:serine/threonine-protein kinase
MYALLTGHLVNEAETSNEALGKAMNDSAGPIRERVPDLPDAIAEVVDRSLEFHKRRRFSSAKDMLDALRTASRDFQLESPALTLPRSGSTFQGVKLSASTPVGSRRYWFALSALLAGLGGVVTLIALGGRPTAPQPDSDPPTKQPTVAVHPPPFTPQITPAKSDDIIDVSSAPSPAVPLPSAPRARSISEVGTTPPPRAAPSASSKGTPIPGPSSSATLPSGCTPPYYLDERGIKHFRPECL